MAQPPPNVFKKDIVANAATLPPSHAAPHAAASAAAGNASPSNHILPTSALMAGVCVLVMALAKLIKLRSGTGLMDLAMAANSVFFLISAVCSSSRCAPEKWRHFWSGCQTWCLCWACCCWCCLVSALPSICCSGVFAHVEHC